MMYAKISASMLAAIALTACGGGGDSVVPAGATSAASPEASSSASTPVTAPSSTTPLVTSTPPVTSPPVTSPPVTSSSVTPTPPTAANAARLLDQATFGVTPGDTAHVQSVGINAYLTEQLSAPVTQYTGYSFMPHTAPGTCVYHSATPTDASSLCSRDQYSLFQVQRSFFTHALNNPDQLRQRVAFALSHIFVVSGVMIYEAYGMAAYQNVLLDDALGNFRTLIQDVTLSPVMGAYLDMVNNDKTNAVKGTGPNENYGREVLQLFSIGVNELNPDGTPTLDANGATIPTYDQDVIEGFSAVFTGWTYPPLAGATSNWGNPLNYTGVMTPIAAHHEPGTKSLLNGVTVSTGGTPAQDLKVALDNIFNHPNVGPFIGKQLIQHLVTSNPSPAYVARISAVFANNGQGTRGDLSAVVRAILTDPEARGDAPVASDFGHLRDPLVFMTGLLRSLGGQSDGVYLRSEAANLGENVFMPPTVFDFYPPSYEIPGTPLLAPQFAIEDAATALARANFVDTVIMQTGAAPNPTVTGSTGTTVNLTALANLKNVPAEVAKLNQVLMHGSLSSAAAAVIATAATAQSSKTPTAAAATAAYLILTSGQYQVER